jgi:DNA-binding protein H-NS
MGRNEIQSMSTDELWDLYEDVTSQLAERITAEKAKLDERLDKLHSGSNVVTLPRVRRPYPKVFPKYQNPKNPAETWSGRGRQPLWVKEQL